MCNRWGTRLAASFSAAVILFSTMSVASAERDITPPPAALTVEGPEEEMIEKVYETTHTLSCFYETREVIALALVLADLSDWIYDTGHIERAALMAERLAYAGQVLESVGQEPMEADMERHYNIALKALSQAQEASQRILGGIDSSTYERPPMLMGRQVFSPDDGSIMNISRGQSYRFAKEQVAYMLTSPRANSMRNFMYIVDYGQNIYSRQNGDIFFTDVDFGDWFYPGIKTAIEYGFMRGISEELFHPSEELTIQEAIVMAARIRCIYEWGSNVVEYPEYAPTGNAGAWACPEINFAIERGIIQRGDFTDYAVPITRAQMAYIFAHTLPSTPSFAEIGAYEPRNTVEDNIIPDVKLSDQYGEEVYTLYRAGILTGSDDNGTFYPERHIDRASAAAIVARLPFTDRRNSIYLTAEGHIRQPRPVGTSYLGDEVTVAPWQGHTIYVGTATNTVGQPRRTAPSGSAVEPITTRYGFHNYYCEDQDQFDAVWNQAMGVYRSVERLGNEALVGAFGLGKDSWDVVDDVIAGRPYREDLWQNFVSDLFPAVEANIDSDQVQAETIKLYAKYRELEISIPTATGESGGFTAYDTMFLGITCCVASSQVQMLAADLLGIDCASFASDDHLSTTLRINGMYFAGEGEYSFDSYEAAVAWANVGQMTEWTSASAPMK